MNLDDGGARRRAGATPSAMIVHHGSGKKES
jgi:hypothetical protein